MKCHKNKRKWIKNGDSCEKNVDKLAFANNPTGTSEMPSNVLR